MPQKPGGSEREGTRYLFDAPVTARCGSATVTVVNASEHGLQIEHAEPLKPAAVCRIAISLPASTEHVELEGQIAWTRLARTAEENRGFVYRSGVKLDDTAENMALIRMVVAAYPGRPDVGAPEERGQNQPMVRFIKRSPKTVDPDRALLIRQVHERLRLDPEAMKVLSGRARSALSIRVASVVHSEIELAVWEYLQHVVSLEDIREALS